MKRGALGAGVHAKVRILFIRATRFGQSRSVIDVNFNPTPPLGIRCCTTASTLICPSPTRKSSLAFSPTGRGVGVERNRPPHTQVANTGNIIHSTTAPIDPHIVACLDTRNHSSRIVYFCQRGCHADLLRPCRFGRVIERTNDPTQGHCGQ